jgi:hypothetical protein
LNAAKNLPPADGSIDAAELLRGSIVGAADRAVCVDRAGPVFDFDVPLPRKKGGARGAGEASAVPFSRIPQGASYFARGAKQSTVSSAATAYRQRNEDVLFVTAYFESDPKYGVAGVRVWRVR